MSSQLNLKKVEELSVKLNNDLEQVKKELKRIQSVKCRLKKQKYKKTYEAEMTETLQYEELLKEVRQLLEPREKFVTQYEQSDVDMLDYDQTIKAIRSIQSKKTLSKWLTENENDNDEYRNAVKIEAMLLEHKKTIQPVDDELYIRKTDLQTIIDTIESTGKISTAKILEMLKELI